MLIFSRGYSWDELSDIDRDVYEAIDGRHNSVGIDGEYKGTIRVTIEYIESEEDEKEKDQS